MWESKRCDGQKRNQWIPALVSNWPTDHPSGESLTGKLVGWTLAPRLNCALFQLCNGLILALQPNSRPKTCPLLPIRRSHVTQAMDALTLGDKSNSELSHLDIESQKKISLKGKTEERKRKARSRADMEFVKNFTHPDFQAKSFTPQKCVICDSFFGN